jgi:ABC-2 type transport system ATP-binding protein
MSMSPLAPLLEAAALRIEEGGRVVTDGLSLKLDGPRAVLVGDTLPLLGPLFGWAGIGRGWLKIMGQEIAAARPRLGLAPLDPPMPDDFTPLEYVAWSGILAGLAPATAASRAEELLSQGGLTDVQHKPLIELGLVPRRITMLAQALVANPVLLIAEGPLDGLDPESGFYVLGALGAMIGKVPAVVTTRAFEPGSPADALARGADEVALLENGEVLEQGRPADLIPAPPSTDVTSPPADADAIPDTDEASQPEETIEESGEPAPPEGADASPPANAPAPAAPADDGPPSP